MAKVSKTKIDAIIKKNKPPVETVELNIGDGMVTVEINPNISHADFVAAARELAEMQFAVDTSAQKDDVSDGGKAKKSVKEFYAPYLSEFAEWYVLLKYYTNIDVSTPAGESDPDAKAFERLWALRNCGDLREKIYATVKDTWFALADSAYSIVEGRKEQLRPGAVKFWNSLDELLETMKQQFYHVSPDDWQGLIEGIGKLSGIDDNKIIQFIRDNATTSEPDDTADRE